MDSLLLYYAKIHMIKKDTSAHLAENNEQGERSDH